MTDGRDTIDIIHALRTQLDQTLLDLSAQSEIDEDQCLAIARASTACANHFINGPESLE